MIGSAAHGEYVGRVDTGGRRGLGAPELTRGQRPIAWITTTADPQSSYPDGATIPLAW